MGGRSKKLGGRSKKRGEWVKKSGIKINYNEIKGYLWNILIGNLGKGKNIKFKLVNVEE